MVEVTQSQQENIAAYKQGVESKAPATGWAYKDAARPVGKSDIEYIGVEESPNQPLQVRTPVGDLTLKQIFAKMANVPEASIKRDIPGNTARYYREIGQHEAGHLIHHVDSMGDERLGEETNGDRTSYNGDDREVEEVIRDTRKLSSMTNLGHATSPSLPDAPGGTPPETNSMKLYHAAKTFRDTVAADLMSNGHIQKIEDIKVLQEKNPEIVQKSVETLQKSGAFDDMEGSKGVYVRQYAQDYLDASKKWLATPEQSLPTQSTPKASVPDGMAP